MIDSSSKTTKYMTVDETIEEAVGRKIFISNFDVIPSFQKAISLLYDNNGVITQAKEQRSYQRSPHIFQRFHLIKRDVKFVFLRRQIRDIRDTNNTLPQSLTCRASSFSVCTCHLLVYTAWTLKGLLAEKVLMIKSAKGLSKSQILY